MITDVKPSFLGVTEAPYYPGAVYLLSIFYNRKEIATRIAILYTGEPLFLNWYRSKS